MPRTTKAERKLENAEDIITQAVFVAEAAVEKCGDDDMAAQVLIRATRTILNTYTGEDQ